MTARVDRTERLLNLVMCLMATHGAVPRSDIQRQIPGYQDSASPAAFERMFERDKDELRSMGIPVETVVDVSGDVLGYRIPQDTYALQDIDFTLPERAALVVAAQVWGSPVVAPVAGTAIRKLEAVDAQGWSPAELAGSVQITSADAALLPLMSAIRGDRVVTFDYRTPAAETAGTREVSPWGLRATSGRWFMVGYDEGRAALRTFRLSRIVGPVTITARKRPHAPEPGADPFEAARTEDESAVTATIRLRPGRGASLRRLATSADPQDERVTVVAQSRDQLVALLCAAGPDAQVVDDPQLAAEVCRALSSILQIHQRASG